MQARTRSFQFDTALDTVMRLFWRKGYGATSARDLVRETGLSTSSLYMTYGDKRELFEASLKKYRDEQSNGLIKALGENAPLRQKLEGIFARTIDQATGSDCKGCLMVNTAVEMAAQDEDIRKVVMANIQDAEDALVFAVERAKSNGETLVALDSRSIARLIFHMLTALKVTSKVMDDRHYLEDAVQAALAAIFGRPEDDHGKPATVN